MVFFIYFATNIDYFLLDNINDIESDDDYHPVASDSDTVESDEELNDQIVRREERKALAKKLAPKRKEPLQRKKGAKKPKKDLVPYVSPNAPVFFAYPEDENVANLVEYDSDDSVDLKTGNHYPYSPYYAWVKYAIKLDKYIRVRFVNGDLSAKKPIRPTVSLPEYEWSCEWIFDGLTKSESMKITHKNFSPYPGLSIEVLKKTSVYRELVYNLALNLAVH